ncbi:MAG: hypothetical protein H6833_07620 [Planctomycetes bacterium]|nr:hypothetical protein [Planctomycetota bacterium]
MERAQTRSGRWIGKTISLGLFFSFVILMVFHAQERARPDVEGQGSSGVEVVPPEGSPSPQDPVHLPSLEVTVPREPVFLPSSKSGVVTMPDPTFFSTSKSLSIDDLPKDVLKSLTEGGGEPQRGEG